VRSSSPRSAPDELRRAPAACGGAQRRGEHHLAVRVHERGSGETRSCGTGACAVAVAAAVADDAERGTAYTVDLPGGTLRLVWTEDDRVLMTGPAVLVAEGLVDLVDQAADTPAPAV